MDCCLNSNMFLLKISLCSAIVSSYSSLLHGFEQFRKFWRNLHFSDISAYNMFNTDVWEVRGASCPRKLIMKGTSSLYKSSICWFKGELPCKVFLYLRIQKLEDKCFFSIGPRIFLFFLFLPKSGNTIEHLWNPSTAFIENATLRTTVLCCIRHLVRQSLGSRFLLTS